MSKSQKKTSQTNTSSMQSPDKASALGSRVSDQPPAAPKGPDRPPRIPMKAGMNLHIPEKYLDRDNFAYRWFAESSLKGGRIEVAKGAYWEHVTDSTGSNFTRPSATDIMYLMRLEIKYWLEDQQAKKNRVAMTMEKEYSIGEGEYAPDSKGNPEGGTRAVTYS